MDIYCPKCNEPWDMDSLHESDFGLTYAQASKLFRTKGCSAVWETKCRPTETPDPRVAAMYELLGDDMDGAAAMFEDFGI